MEDGVFDPKSEAKEFVADDRETALAEACRFFDAEESELTIVEPDPISVSGLASRVLLVAALKNRPAPRTRDRDRGDRGERGDRDRGREDRDRGRDRDRGGDGSRRRGGRGDSREGRGSRRDGRGDGRDRNDRRDRPAARERSEERAAAAPVPVEGPSEATVTGELSEYGEFVKGVVERMKLGCFEISESQEEELVAVLLSGDAAVRLSTAETRVGDAIQLLANQVAVHGGRSGPRIVVDVEGEREKREAYLVKLAKRACDRAESSGAAVALDPMNGSDRRTIHLAIREIDGVATMSVGDGMYRQVVVVPEGADNYEEALRSSEEASRSDRE